jgi:hypothetical protein
MFASVCFGCHKPEDQWKKVRSQAARPPFSESTDASERAFAQFPIASTKN